MIIAHRGYVADNIKENTLSSFEKAFAVGADGIECDIRLTRDKKIVVAHDNKFWVSGKKFFISRLPLKIIQDLYAENNQEILTIDELFPYIQKTPKSFFLEVKSSSSILIELLIEKIEERNLWDKVYVMGFSFLVKNGLALQQNFPKLRVMRFITFPAYSRLKKPRACYGVLLGWLDGIVGSRKIFKIFNSKKHLIHLRNFYEKNNIKVMAGVINNAKDFKFFKEIGINDIVTDNVVEAVAYFKNR